VPLPVTDLLRPTAQTTPEFGGKWKSPQFSQTAARKVEGSGIKTARQLLAALSKRRFHPIEAIDATNEGIVCAQLMGTPQWVLVHSKVSPASVDATVKTAHPTFTAAVADVLSSCLKD
jgi:hypothetical protein